MRQPFARWKVVTALFVMMMFASGLGFYSQSVLIEALTRERGLSVAAASSASSVFFAVGGLAGLGIATLIERIDARWSVFLGSLLAALSLVAIGRVETMAMAYLAFGLFGIGFACTNILTASTVVTRWFVRRQALALSVVFTGLSVGGIVVAPLAARVLGDFGLERGVDLLAIAYVLGIVPVTFVWMKPRPDGSVDMADELENVEDPGVDARDAFRSRYFVGIAGAFGLGLMSQVGAIAHQFSLVSRHAPAVAGAAVSLLAAASVVGRLASGAALARLPYRGFTMLLLVLQGSALVALGGTASAAGLLLSSVAFGLTVGSFLMMQSLLLAEAFGTRSFARIYSVSALFTSVGVSLGPLFLGWAHDATGGYRSAYLLAAAASWLGCLALAAAGRGYRRPRGLAAQIRPG